MTLHTFTKSFFQICRELVLAFGVALLIPFITYYTTIIVHPEPTYPSYKQAYYDEESETNITTPLAEQFKEIKRKRKKLLAEEKSILDSGINKNKLAAIQAELTTLNSQSEALLAQNKLETTKEEEARKVYDAAYSSYRRSYFFIAVTIGLLAIVIGMFISLISLGVGFILGGFISLVLGYVTYWGALHNVIKLLSLLGALALILIISFYRFGKQKED